MQATTEDAICSSIIKFISFGATEVSFKTATQAIIDLLILLFSKDCVFVSCMRCTNIGVCGLVSPEIPVQTADISGYRNGSLHSSLRG